MSSFCTEFETVRLSKAVSPRLYCYCPLFSLTSLFYGEPNEKEKSPSESSPSDSETKDMVSFVLFGLEFLISS